MTRPESLAAVSKLLNTDAIDRLHPDVAILSEMVHSDLKRTRSKDLAFDSGFYSTCKHAIVALTKAGHLTPHPVARLREAGGFTVATPAYLVRLSAFENKHAMDDLIQNLRFENPSEALGVDVLAKDLQLPLPIVQAVVDVFRPQVSAPD